MLATARDLADDQTTARQLMKYAESLSRRDLPTEMWFIEDAVRHNDIPTALHHYDIALRGSESAHSTLFSVLNGAIAQPEVTDALAQSLTARPMWADAFLQQAVQHAPDLSGLTRLLVELGRYGFPLPPTTTAVASARLVGAHRYEDAWQIYQAGHQDADRSGLRDPAFSKVNALGAPFEWALIQTNDFSAQPGGGGRLAYTALTGAGGVVARQLLMLPPQQEFTLSGRSFDTQGRPTTRLRITCSDGRQIGEITIPSGDRFSGSFTAPSECRAQWLEILVDGGDSPAGAAGEIGELHLAPGRPHFLQTTRTGHS